MPLHMRRRRLPRPSRESSSTRPAMTPASATSEASLTCRPAAACAGVLRSRAPEAKLATAHSMPIRPDFANICTAQSRTLGRCLFLHRDSQMAVYIANGGDVCTGQYRHVVGDFFPMQTCAMANSRGYLSTTMHAGGAVCGAGHKGRTAGAATSQRACMPIRC